MSFGLTFKEIRRRFGFFYNYRSESIQVFIRKVKPENYLKSSIDSYFDRQLFQKFSFDSYFEGTEDAFLYKKQVSI